MMCTELHERLEAGANGGDYRWPRSRASGAFANTTSSSSSRTDSRICRRALRHGRPCARTPRRSACPRRGADRGERPPPHARRPARRPGPRPRLDRQPERTSRHPARAGPADDAELDRTRARRERHRRAGPARPRLRLLELTAPVAGVRARRPARRGAVDDRLVRPDCRALLRDARRPRARDDRIAIRAHLG